MGHAGMSHVDRMSADDLFSDQVLVSMATLVIIKGRLIYKIILSLVHSLMGGGLPPDVLNGASYDILLSLKDESLKDVDRKRDIEDVLAAKLTSEAFPVGGPWEENYRLSASGGGRSSGACG